MHNSLPLTVADYVILALLALGLLQGYVRGLSGELARVLGWVAALFFGWKFSSAIGDWFIAHSRLEGVSAYFGGFVAAVLAAGLLVYGLHRILRLLFTFSFTGKIERVGGLLAGLVRMGAFVALVVLGVSLWRIEPLHTAVCVDSRIGRVVSGSVLPLYDHLLARHPEWNLPEPPAPEAETEGTAPPPPPGGPAEPALDWEHWPAQ